MAQAYANNLTPIYCVGENLDEREAGKHFDVVKAQIERVVYNLSGGAVQESRDRLRTRLGHRYGQDRHGRPGAGDHAYIRKVLADKFRPPLPVPDPLRRFVQALGAAKSRQGGCRRRSDRRCRP